MESKHRFLWRVTLQAPLFTAGKSLYGQRDNVMIHHDHVNAGKPLRYQQEAQELSVSDVVPIVAAAGIRR